jgi:hypothetical protein
MESGDAGADREATTGALANLGSIDRDAAGHISTDIDNGDAG